MNRNDLKTLAVIAMTFDHIALAFVPVGSIWYALRLVGRLTAPIMTFMLTEGFRHTRSRTKYLLRLSVFALISQPFYFVLSFGRPPVNALEFLSHWNVLFTLAVTLSGLCIMESKLTDGKKLLCTALVVSLAGFGDWSFLIPAWAAVFFWFGDKDFRTKALLFALVSVVLLPLIYRREFDSFLTFSFEYGTLLALIPLSRYDGSPGKVRHKKFSRWFFYVYYPAHMLVLVLLKALY